MEKIQESEIGKGTAEDQQKDASFVKQNFEDQLGSGEKILGLQCDRESNEFKFTISKFMAHSLPPFLADIRPSLPERFAWF